MLLHLLQDLDVFHQKLLHQLDSLLELGLENKKVAIISQDRYEWCCSYLAIAASVCIKSSM